MPEAPFAHLPVALRGGGDLGSGVAYRLHRTGFPVLVLELPRPLLVRRAVAYGSAAIEGTITVEGITARRVEDLTEVRAAQRAGEIPVLIDPAGESLADYDPAVLVDARMTKRDPGAQPLDAPLAIGLGPGFVAGQNCDAVIETNRGHNLGRVIWQGAPEPDTGRPGRVLGHAADRVLRAPVAGVVRAAAPIGAALGAGDPAIYVGNEVVTAPFDGVLRGVVHDGLHVEAGTKIGDLDPRGIREYCFTISDKALAIGGGALEAVLSAPALRERLCPVG